MCADRHQLKRLLASHECHLTASTFDPLSARLAEQSGFRLGMFGGSAAALVILGAPDLSLVSLAELAEQTRRICRATRIPIVVDADHGFGNALSVMRTVLELQCAGAAGISLEDTEPQGFGQATPALVSREAAVGKLQAALEARKGEEFVLLARTNALKTGDLEETLERLRLYQAVQPDALFVTGIRRPEEMEAIAKVAELPLVIGDVPSELIQLEWLARLGVRVCIPGHQALGAAIAAIEQAFSLQKAGRYAHAESLAPASEVMAAVTCLNEYHEFSRRFLGVVENTESATDRT